ANLDGGGRSMMVVDGKIINNPAGWGYSGERYVINAIVYK
ncbi:MAG: phosphodiester glycosidase family protein, partial [Erysipelotrichaceae bacterium]|nr:phosphodiester glycosidase family protein [Erysipelotrichaceae bacterium]